MRNKELDDLCDNLQKNAEQRMLKEIRESQKYQEGYNQACEDFLKGAQSIVQGAGGVYE